jgi:hypothetical protein
VIDRHCNQLFCQLRKGLDWQTLYAITHGLELPVARRTRFSGRALIKQVVSEIEV